MAELVDINFKSTAPLTCQKAVSTIQLAVDAPRSGTQQSFWYELFIRWPCLLSSKKEGIFCFDDVNKRKIRKRVQTYTANLNLLRTNVT